LRLAMTQRQVREIEKRGPLRRARVQDLEGRLQIPVKINGRTRAPLEGQREIAVVPPSMRDTAREVYPLAGPGLNLLASELRRERAGDHDALFILEVMNVQRRTQTMGGQRPTEFEERFTVFRQSPKIEDLAGVSVLESQIGWR